MEVYHHPLSTHMIADMPTKFQEINHTNNGCWQLVIVINKCLTHKIPT